MYTVNNKIPMKKFYDHECVEVLDLPEEFHCELCGTELQQNLETGEYFGSPYTYVSYECPKCECN